MTQIDLTHPTKTFIVQTSVRIGAELYMGPEVKINANSALDAEKRAIDHGHMPNKYFPPQEVKK